MKSKEGDIMKKTAKRSFLLPIIGLIALSLFIGSCDNDDGGGGPKPTPTPTATPQPTPPPPTPTPIPSPGFQTGDIIPGFVLSSMPSGSIADVRAKGTYIPNNSKWEVFFVRSLTTEFPEEDVQFDFTSPSNLFFFSIAYLDNTGAAPPLGAAAAVMFTQDTTAYTLGNESSVADLKAVMETPSDCSDLTGDPLLTTPIDPSTVPELTLRAAFDEENLYLCVEAPDPNDVEDNLKEHWEFLGPADTDWERKPSVANVMSSISEETGKFDEDRIAIWFDINAEGFETTGCTSLCHEERMQSTNPDGRADLWHWKAARTNTAGFAEDQRLDPDKAKCPNNPCRQNDSATKGIASKNEQTVDSIKLPGFMAENDPGANVLFLFDDEVTSDCPPGDCDLAVPFLLP